MWNWQNLYKKVFKMEEYVQLLKELDAVIIIYKSKADYEFKCKSIMNKYYRHIEPLLHNLDLSIDYDETAYSSFQETIEGFITRILPIKHNIQAILYG
jgi:hypothetical protein